MKFYEWHKINVQRAAGIGNGHTGQFPTEYAGDVNAVLLQKTAAELQAFRRIVVSADEKDLHLQLRQFSQKCIEQRDSICRRNGFVVDVAGKEHP